MHYHHLHMLPANHNNGVAMGGVGPEGPLETISASPSMQNEGCTMKFIFLLICSERIGPQDKD